MRKHVKISYLFLISSHIYDRVNNDDLMWELEMREWPMNL